MNDELLIQTIRRAMRDEVAELHVPPQILSEVMASPPRQRRRAPLGWVMPTLAAAAAVAVSVVAVTSLTHRRLAPQGGSAPASIPVAARGLASRLAVLRRPQRPADRLPAWAVRETESLLQNGRVIGGLSRRVGAVHLGQYGSARVYLVVHRPPRFPIHRMHVGPPLLNPRLGDQATIAFVGPFREEAAINGPTVAAGGQQVAATSHGLIGNPGEFSALWGAVASIVPDGVWRVKWVFQTPNGPSRRITVWPHLHANVAIGKLPPRLQFFMRGAVWYGAHGQVIAAFGTSTGPSLKAQNFKRALEASLHQRVDSALLRHFALLRTTGRGGPRLTEADAYGLLEPNPLDLNLRRARFVDHSPGAAFVVPGRQGMAIRSVRPMVGQAEAGTSVALAGGLFIESPRVADRRTIIGVAPDGNRTVTVLLRGGGRRSARVVDNVYAIVVPPTARTLVIKNSSGRTVRLRIG